eukprot:Pgem_evm1s10402
MRSFAKELFPTVKDETFYESCGVADLIATCYGGRNHKVASAFARNKGVKSFEELEKEMLGGGKLQGVLTSNEVQTVLHDRKWEKNYPLFTAVNAIVQGLYPPKDIAQYRDLAAKPKPVEMLLIKEPNNTIQYEQIVNAMMPTVAKMALVY